MRWTSCLRTRHARRYSAGRFLAPGDRSSLQRWNLCHARRTRGIQQHPHVDDRLRSMKCAHEHVRRSAAVAFAASASARRRLRNRSHRSRSAPIRATCRCPTISGEGFENKIAATARQRWRTVQYYWRPSIERGLMRTTLEAGSCDLWMDMAVRHRRRRSPRRRCIAPRSCSRTATTAASTSRTSTIRACRSCASACSRFPRSARRSPCTASWQNTVVHYLVHNGDLVPGEPALLPGATGDRRQLDIAARMGADGRLLTNRSSTRRS